MNKEPKTIQERSQEFHARMTADQNLNPDMFTKEMCEDIVQQYIVKYEADINSPTFVDDLIELYNKQYNYNLENSIEGGHNEAIVISVKNISDESIFNVPLFNQDNFRDQKLIYSTPFYDNSSRYSADKITYDMLGKEFLNFSSESDETIRTIRIMAISKTSSAEKQVLIPVRIVSADIFSSSCAIPIDNHNPTLLDLRLLKNIIDYNIDARPFRKGLTWNLEFNEILPQTELRITLIMKSKGKI